MPLPRPGTDPVLTAVPGTATLLLGAYDLAGIGYVAEEFFISGTASAYVPVAAFGSDGRWSAAPSGVSEYTTRLVVVKPADPARFNRTVIVEWLNVSAGMDAPAEWLMAHREMVRAGYVYVAVSAQRAGVEGGERRGADMSLKSANMSLKNVAPVRYSTLSHPGDAFSYDIFSQVGRVIRDGKRNGVLGPLSPQLVLAAGESQSAMFLTTYVNAVDALVKVYDGFLVHSRFAGAAALDGSSIFGPSSATMPQVVNFRPELRVPLIAIITETDLLGGARSGYYRARQPDNEWLRTWEIPGAAHADNYVLQVAAIDSGSAPLNDILAAYAPTNNLMGAQLSHSINFAAQHHYVVQAALASLHRWVSTGEPASNAARIELSDADPPELVLDANGIARGGVRTPWVDVPIARTSGLGNDESAMSGLFGSGELFSAATLNRLYPAGADQYLERFTASLDTAVHAKFVLATDRREILELAAATAQRLWQSHRAPGAGTG